MTRAEAAAIFARLLAEKNGDTISTAANTRFTDIPAHAWYSGYAKYLNNNGVTYGKSKTIFAPDDAITRAEFTTLAVRFFDVYGDGDAEIMEQYKDFNDVSDGYWAAAYIKAATKHGWINGYGDGSFRAGDKINRAEVVTIVNRLLGREADEAYIADNLRKLNTFPGCQPQALGVLRSHGGRQPPIPPFLVTAKAGASKHPAALLMPGGRLS